MKEIKRIKMSVGDRVVIVEDSELRKGTIEKIFSEIAPVILLVKFDNGEMRKMLPTDVALEPKENDQEKKVDEHSEPVEKTEITITPEEFSKIATKLVVKEFETGGPLLLSVGTILVAKLHQALFYDEGENE